MGWIITYNIEMITLITLITPEIEFLFLFLLFLWEYCLCVLTQLYPLDVCLN
jgi:hypothetical protein